MQDRLKTAQEDVKKLKKEKRQLEKELVSRRKPGPKKKDNVESKDNTGQTSEQKHSTEEEEKDSAGQTTDQKT